MSVAFSVARVERAPPPAAFDLAVDLDLDPYPTHNHR
jgi:hypothetical protein